METRQPELVLDIGTHKVLALAVEPRDEGIAVLASAFLRHPERSMRDGQVHDVAAVARTVRRAVEHVSRAVGVEFAGAHIAAAGRALKTARGGAERSEPQPVLITPALADMLEWEAVADAQRQLLESLPAAEREKGFYCIAHAVVESRLDGDVIGSLANQRGRVFSVEVLATFLPAVVVDSLEAVLAEAGLEMRSLTLEPVAALEAVIPPTMRHLNLALVDIGAGTSDIALTGGGTIRAFAMVPRGGDAITEAVSEAYLLDFPVAELAKRTASAGNVAAVENVLGETVQIGPRELEAAARQTTQRLAEDIAAAMRAWTEERTPDALLLVGGGSHTPGLPQALARCLGLDERRVAVRDRRAVRAAVGEEQLAGADVVTALGIALRAMRGKGMPPVRVRVNNRPVSLFQPERCTVREAVRIAGVPPAQLTGRPGPGITVTLNGVVTPLPGQRGEPAAVFVNGEPATLDTRLRNQDHVTLKLPAPGAPARVSVGELARRWLAQRRRSEEPVPHIWLNGVRRPVPLRLLRNGRLAHPGEIVADRDVIEIRFVALASELLEALRIPELFALPLDDAADNAAPGETATPAAPPPPHPAERAVAAGALPLGRCTVNGRAVDLAPLAALWRNGRPARPTDPVQDGDVWEVRDNGDATVARVLELAGEPLEKTLTITLNGEPTTLSLPVDVRLNGRPAAPEDRVRDGDRIETSAAAAAELYQILPFAGVSPDQADGRLVLLVRGRAAGFTTPVSDGDDVVIRYEP